LSRRAAGETVKPQLLAANIDSVFLVAPAIRIDNPDSASCSCQLAACEQGVAELFDDVSSWPNNADFVIAIIGETQVAYLRKLLNPGNSTRGVLQITSNSSRSRKETLRRWPSGANGNVKQASCTKQSLTKNAAADTVPAQRTSPPRRAAVHGPRQQAAIIRMSDCRSRPVPGIPQHAREPEWRGDQQTGQPQHRNNDHEQRAVEEPRTRTPMPDRMTILQFMIFQAF
jgi:hypothetical protein